MMDKDEIKKAWVGVDRRMMAKQLGTSMCVIHHLAGGFKRPSPVRAKEIEAITEGKVKAALYWPMLFQ